MKAAKPKPKKPRIYGVSFASVYPLYIKKAEAKGRTKAEVDEIICWLTGHTAASLISSTSSPRGSPWTRFCALSR